MARPCSSSPMTSRPPGPVTAASISSNLRSSSRRHCRPLSFAFAPAHLMRRCPSMGKSLQAADYSRFTQFPATSACRRSRSHLGFVRPALVQPRLPRRHLHRLLVSAEADQAARRADGPPPCRRPGLLRRARHHPRRPHRLCPVLQSRLLPPAPARDLEAVGRRHVVPRRRDRHRRSASSISRARRSCPGCGSTIMSPAACRSACSSAASPIS